MTDLPPAVEAYLRAVDAADPEQVLACFAPDAVVVDGPATITGRAELAAWVQGHLVAPRVRHTVLAATERGGRHVVTADLDGDFPGAPVRLDVGFVVAGGLLTRLLMPAPDE